MLCYKGLQIVRGQATDAIKAQKQGVGQSTCKQTLV